MHFFLYYITTTYFENLVRKHFFPFEIYIIVGHKMGTRENRMVMLKCLDLKRSWLSSSPNSQNQQSHYHCYQAASR